MSKLSLDWLLSGEVTSDTLMVVVVVVVVVIVNLVTCGKLRSRTPCVSKEQIVSS